MYQCRKLCNKCNAVERSSSKTHFSNLKEGTPQKNINLSGQYIALSKGTRLRFSKCFFIAPILKVISALLMVTLW